MPRPRTPNRLRRERNTASQAVNKVNRQAKREEQRRWGQVSEGDMVTSRGRHGTGQPVVTGTLKTILAHGDCIVQLPDGSKRHRTIRNLRKV